jgi:hypothetical protein
MRTVTESEILDWEQRRRRRTLLRVGDVDEGRVRVDAGMRVVQEGAERCHMVIALLSWPAAVRYRRCKRPAKSGGLCTVHVRQAKRIAAKAKPEVAAQKAAEGSDEPSHG